MVPKTNDEDSPEIKWWVTTDFDTTTLYMKHGFLTI